MEVFYNRVEISVMRKQERQMKSAYAQQANLVKNWGGGGCGGGAKNQSNSRIFYSYD